MPNRQLQIDLLINNMQARHAAQQIIADARAVAREWNHAAASIQAAMGRYRGPGGSPTATGAAREPYPPGAFGSKGLSPEQLAALADREEAKEYQRQVRRQARQEAAARAAAEMRKQQADRDAADTQRRQEQAEASEYRRWGRALREEERQAERKRRVAEKSARDREAIEDRFAAQEYRRQVRRMRDEEAAAAKKKSMTDRIGDSVLRVAAGYATWSAATNFVGDLLQQAQRLADENERIVQAMRDQRDVQRELMNIQGKPSTTATTLETARLAAATGFRADEANQFYTAMLASGEQYKDRFGVGRAGVDQKAAAAQFQQFQQVTGQLTAISGIRPDVMGDLAGVVMGQGDWTQRGGGMGAAAQYNAIVKVLQAGRGRTEENARNASEAMARLMSGADSVRSLFKSTTDVAAMVGTISEADPGQAEVYTRAVARFVRDFRDPKKRGLFGRAGVTMQDDVIAAVEKLAPVLTAEAARTPGATLQDVIARYTNEEREKGGLAVAISKGIGEGVIAQRRQVAAQASDPALIRQQIAAAQGDPFGAMASRMAEGRRVLAEQAANADKVMVQDLRNRAVERMRTRGTYEATWSDTIRRYTTPEGWSLGGQEARIRDEMGVILQERAQQAGLLRRDMRPEAAGFFADDFVFKAMTQAGSQTEAANYMTRIMERGIDPVTGAAMARDAMATFWEMNRNLAEIRAALTAPPVDGMPQAAPPLIQAAPPPPPVFGQPQVP